VLPLLASDAYHRGHWRNRKPRAFSRMFDKA
jgi:deoxyhypusine synthase